MSVVRISLSYALAVSCLAWHTAAGAEDCHLQQLASLNITETPSGDLLVPVSVAGTPRIFQVDLGAAFSAISDSSANTLSLKREPMPIPHRLSSVVIYHQSAPTIAHAPLELGNLRAEAELVVATPVGEWTPSADGVLGLDIANPRCRIGYSAQKGQSILAAALCGTGRLLEGARGLYCCTPNVSEVGEHYFANET
jgi:hypothetical protein